MADKKKKKKKPQAAQQVSKEVIVNETVTAEAENAVVADKAKTVDKKVVPAKKVTKKAKKPNIFARLGKKLKEVFSELKKVTWPTFPVVLRQTGVVLAVVAFFLVLIFLFDSGFAYLYSLLFPTSV